MTECDAVRQLLEGDAQDPRVARHLEQCAACRAESAFQQRITAAVAGMQRVPAPEGFAAKVMAQVQSRPAVVPPVRRAPPLLLRPWELGWLGAACLLLLVWLSQRVLTGSWPVFVSMRLPQTSIVTSDVWPLTSAPFADAWQSLTGIGPLVSEWGSGWTGTPAPWLAGAVAFAVAFALLLSWRPGGRGQTEGDEAYA
jgi:anti-sigma factor RsiW